MRFKDVQCVYCNKTFTENDDVVVCPQCGSPHHRECWKEKGECSNKELHAEDFCWEFPAELKPKLPQRNKENLSENAVYKFKNGESTVICPHCGSLNYGFDAVCMNCKKPLTDNRVSESNYDGENSADAPGDLSGEKLYEYYLRFGGLRPETKIDSVPACEYAAYIGNKSGRYIRKFAIIERFARKFSVSFWAFLFGPVWFFYRKMYKEGLIFLLTLLVLAGAQSYCSLTEPMKAYLNDSGDVIAETLKTAVEKNAFEQKDIDEANKKIEELAQIYDESEFSSTDKAKYICSTIIYYIYVSLSLVMALSADILYKKKIKKDIYAIRKKHKDKDTYLKALEEKGGVSIIGAVAGAIASFAVTVLSVLPSLLILADKIKDIR